MAILKFYDRFVPSVYEGRKLSSIRRDKKGEVGDDVLLTDTEGNKIRDGVFTEIIETFVDNNSIVIYGIENITDKQELDDFANEDGFANFEEMKTWFDRLYGLPFSGWLHVWELKEAN